MFAARAAVRCRPSPAFAARALPISRSSLSPRVRLYSEQPPPSPSKPSSSASPAIWAGVGGAAAVVGLYLAWATLAPSGSANAVEGKTCPVRPAEIAAGGTCPVRPTAEVSATAPGAPVAAPKGPVKVPTSSQYDEMVLFVRALQDKITSGVEELERTAPAVPRPTSDASYLSSLTSLFSSADKASIAVPAPATTPATFLHDSWQRPNSLSTGTSCVISDGRVIQKGGVNISISQGVLPPHAVAAMRADHASIGNLGQGDRPLQYAAASLSLVLHPVNPMAPTVHANYRYFEIYPDPDDATKEPISWFGGGADLTPNYLFDEDAVHFHSTLKNACDAHGEAYYPKFKAWADKYFLIPHRKECRGVGGIFFDDLDPSSAVHGDCARWAGGDRPTRGQIFQFVQDCGNSFNEAYLPILARRTAMPFTEQQYRWQQLRRGRYVEFNLVNDRGTQFGLRVPGARIESILMSLPTTARWEYCTDMGAEGTEEGRLLEVLRTPREWL